MRVDVAAAAVDDEPGDVVAPGGGRQHLAPVAELGRIGGVDDEHRADDDVLGDGDVDREVVGLAALGRDRRAGDLRACPRRLDARSMRSAPLSPSVADPSAISSSAVSAIVNVRCS